MGTPGKEERPQGDSRAVPHSGPVRLQRRAVWAIVATLSPWHKSKPALRRSGHAAARARTEGASTQTSRSNLILKRVDKGLRKNNLAQYCRTDFKSVRGNTDAL